MYVPGFFGILVLIFAILLMVGVVPLSPMVVGGLFVLVSLGFAGPYVVRAA